jgi:DNA (cytosine-5)-methyltransferase 1
MVYYNEIDPYAAQWLRNLISAGHIAKGDVDERSIKDVKPDDLRGYTQCHFFAGIGVWSYALRLAGWPDDRPVWTGSCPCQPFSAAGKQQGVKDERHLWPVWFNLIRECRPDVVFGEQVEAAVRHGWLDLVQADLEGIDYACGAVGLPAGGVGAPHIRQRLWFVADAESPRWGVRHAHDQRATDGEKHTPRNYCKTDRLDNTDDEGLEGLGRGHQAPSGRFGALRSVAEAGESRGLADPSHGAGHGSEPRAVVGLDAQGAGTVQAQHGNAGPTNNHWREADWLLCRDGKWRPVEPGTFPLAHGAAARVGRLRAYGNAIVAQVAQVFIEAYLES